MMNHGMQELIGAQIEVNRAVFEANKDQPNVDYIEQKITEAIKGLAGCHLEILKSKTPKSVRKRGR